MANKKSLSYTNRVINKNIFISFHFKNIFSYCNMLKDILSSKFYDLIILALKIYPENYPSTQ